MSAPRSLNALQIAERLIGLGLCQGFSGVSRGVVLDDGSLTAFVCSQCGESVCKGALHSDKVQ